MHCGIRVRTIILKEQYVHCHGCGNHVHVTHIIQDRVPVTMVHYKDNLGGTSLMLEHKKQLRKERWQREDVWSKGTIEKTVL